MYNLHAAGQIEVYAGLALQSIFDKAGENRLVSYAETWDCQRLEHHITSGFLNGDERFLECILIDDNDLLQVFVLMHILGQSFCRGFGAIRQGLGTPHRLITS